MVTYSKDAGETTFQYDQRKFRWGQYNRTNGGGWWQLTESHGASDMPVSYHSRAVEFLVQPDFGNERYFWTVTFKSYTPKVSAKNPKPARPKVVKWGTAQTLEDARRAAFTAYTDYREAGSP